MNADKRQRQDLSVFESVDPLFFGNLQNPNLRTSIYPPGFSEIANACGPSHGFDAPGPLFPYRGAQKDPTLSPTKQDIPIVVCGFATVKPL
jgi:hypothetical protein